MFLRRPNQWWLPVTAVLAFAWVVIRAAHQSITIDEADSYLTFVGSSQPYQWYPASNNHVLNSLLMKLSTSVLGLSPLSVRTPAILGAGLYITFALLCSRLMFRSLFLQWTLFVCLACNPFVFDYMVAGRGYSLALAFLLLQLYMTIRLYVLPYDSRAVLRTAVICSVAAGLSFSASFAFAVVNGVTMTSILLLCVSKLRHRLPASAAAAACCLFPGLIVAGFLSASAVLNMPRVQLWYGSTTLDQMLISVRDSLLYEVNSDLVNPLLYSAVVLLGSYLLPVVGALSATRILYLLLKRRAISFAGLHLASILGITIGIHWLAYKLTGLLMPLERTALFVVPLGVLATGSLVAIFDNSLAGKCTQGALAGAMFVLSLYFLFCLRLNYFREWKYDADMERAYNIVAYYNHAQNVREVPSHWRYSACLNFYRTMSGREDLQPFTHKTGPDKRIEYPVGRKVYVLYDLEDRNVIASEGLKVIYHGDFSQVVVAVRP